MRKLDPVEAIGVTVRMLAEAVAVILFLSVVAMWGIILATRLPA